MPNIRFYIHPVCQSYTPLAICIIRDINELFDNFSVELLSYMIWIVMILPIRLASHFVVITTTLFLEIIQLDCWKWYCVETLTALTIRCTYQYHFLLVSLKPWKIDKNLRAHWIEGSSNLNSRERNHVNEMPLTSCIINSVPMAGGEAYRLRFYFGCWYG